MIRINLLGVEAAPAKRRVTMPSLGVGGDQLGLVALLVVCLAVVGAAWWYQRGRLSALRADLASIQAESARLTDAADRVHEIQEQTELLRQKLQVIVDLKANQTGPVLMLDQISRLLSDGLWLSRLETARGSVQISGAALSNVSIADFVSNLEGSRYFDDVVLRFSEDTGDAFRFQVNLTFSPNERPADQGMPLDDVGS